MLILAHFGSSHIPWLKPLSHGSSSGNSEACLHLPADELELPPLKDATAAIKFSTALAVSGSVAWS